MKLQFKNIEVELWFMPHYMNFCPMIGLYNRYAHEHKADKVIKRLFQFIWFGVGFNVGWPSDKWRKVFKFEKKWIVLDNISGRLYRYNKETKFFKKIV